MDTMKREILFKAKRADNKEWVAGLIRYNSAGHPHMIEQCGFDKPYEGVFDIIPETVCQFTGLTDKNGVRIFEGDIIAGDGEDVPNRTVEWSNDYLGYFVGLGQGDMQYPLYDVLFPEVIGNIHDKKELNNND